MNAGRYKSYRFYALIGLANAVWGEAERIHGWDWWRIPATAFLSLILLSMLWSAVQDHVDTQVAKKLEKAREAIPKPIVFKS